MDVSIDKRAEGVFQLVEGVVSTYRIEKKLVVQTYDGAVIMSVLTGGPQALVI